MTPYEHRQQRLGHRFRYGFRHWNQHRKGESHHHAPVEGIDWRAWKVAGTGLFVLVVLVVVVLGALAARNILRAQHSMDAARTTISAALDNRHELTTPVGRAEAGAAIDDVQLDVNLAYALVNDSFAVNFFGSLPVLHGQIQGLLQLIHDAGQTATLAGGLLQQVDTLAASTQGLTVSIPQLQSLQTSVASAHTQLAGLNRPSGGLWGPLGSARASFDAEDARLTALLGTGSSVLSYALPLVGADGPRVYLIAGQNNAEMRDQGEVLSNALMHSANGTFSLDSTATSDATLAQPVNVPLPPGTQAIFGALNPTELWQSVNATADFPLSAQIMQAMYQEVTGIHVNGVVGIDVPGLVSLLQLSGPVIVPDIAGEITADNASDVLLHQLYADFPAGDQTQRHDDISAVAKAVIDKMKTEHVDLAALAVALANDVAGRHLMAWDENPTYEATIVKTGGSGAIDTSDADRTFHVSVQSATAAKLDYYVTTSVRMVVSLTGRNTAIGPHLRHHHQPCPRRAATLGPAGTGQLQLVHPRPVRHPGLSLVPEGIADLRRGLGVGPGPQPDGHLGAGPTEPDGRLHHRHPGCGQKRAADPATGAPTQPLSGSGIPPAGRGPQLERGRALLRHRQPVENPQPDLVPDSPLRGRAGNPTKNRQFDRDILGSRSFHSHNDVVLIGTPDVNSGPIRGETVQ